MTSLLELLVRVLAPLELALAAGLGVGHAGSLPAAVLVGLVGAAAVLAIVVVARAVLALAGLGAAVPGTVLTEAADVRLLVFARDPDSDGHVRSRAPGRLLTAV
jgi:hypothetical protein